MEDYPMAIEPTSRPTNHIAPPFTAKPRSRWDRPLAIAAAVVFFISSAFPVVGCFVKDKEAWPKWFGVLSWAGAKSRTGRTLTAPVLL
jgi:hypothetical protein